MINIYASIVNYYCSNTGKFSLNTNIGRIIVSTLCSIINIESINIGIYTFNITPETQNEIII